jgi:hypothetical protein
MLLLGCFRGFNRRQHQRALAVINNAERGAWPGPPRDAMKRESSGRFANDGSPESAARASLEVLAET